MFDKSIELPWFDLAHRGSIHKFIFCNRCSGFILTQFLITFLPVQLFSFCSVSCTSASLPPCQSSASTWVTCMCADRLSLTSNGSRGRVKEGLRKDWRPPCSKTGRRGCWDSQICGFRVSTTFCDPFPGLLILSQLHDTHSCIQSAIICRLPSKEFSSLTKLLVLYLSEIHCPCDDMALAHVRLRFIIFVMVKFIIKLCAVVPLWVSSSLWWYLSCNGKVYYIFVNGHITLKSLLFWWHRSCHKNIYHSFVLLCVYLWWS